ncbi:hypothetical protein EPH_0010300 [Eimeria praecox]|uniref:Uncharacterized protein n=1 Tax=Eimeria praecox TaxID=51316 RepID=U6GS34_9EIME|nr:hypothetical protein EPH_0010300 [Eimeria praecox]
MHIEEAACTQRRSCSSQQHLQQQQIARNSQVVGQLQEKEVERIADDEAREYLQQCLKRNPAAESKIDAATSADGEAIQQQQKLPCPINNKQGDVLQSSFEVYKKLRLSISEDSVNRGKITELLLLLLGNKRERSPSYGFPTLCVIAEVNEM